MFSSAAPIGAILSTLLFAALQTTQEAENDKTWPALAMLFSAGTFLYVATVHVLVEVSGGKKLVGRELIVVVVGMGVPLLLGGILPEG